MVPRWLLPVVVILAAVGVPALLGGGSIARERNASLGDEVRALREAAAALEGNRESILAAAVEEIRRDPGAARRVFIDGEGTVLPFPSAPPASPELRLRLERAQEMGDRLAAAGDTLRAVDAYTMPLSGLDEPRARAPILLSAARVALTSDELAPWGHATLVRLRDRPIAGALDPALGPVDLAAALALPVDSAAPITASVLLSRAGDAAAPYLAALAARFRARPGWIEDADLDAKIAEGVRVRGAILRQVGELRAGRPALTDGLLLLPMTRGEEGTPGEIEIAIGDLRPWFLPPAERYELSEREFDLPLATTSWPDPYPDRVELDIDIAGTTVARHSLFDREAPERRAAIGRLATAYKLLLGAVLATIALALIVSWIAIDRKARLAALRVRLLANVSHELKTPVTSIRLLGELLRDPSLPRARVAEFGELIERESQRLGRRIEEILETAWSRASAAPLARAEVELGAVIDEVAERFRSRAEGAGGAIEVVAASRSPVVETNRDALERIVENLLDNAIKFGVKRAKNGTGDSAEGPRISVSVAGEPGTARVTVEDDGPGVPAGEGERIFEPFYRAAFDDFAVPGTGLGLSISRSFAERLGGSLEYTPRPGGGSRFTLTLPCRVEG